MIFYTDAQVFDHRTPKEAFIAVLTDDERLISFLRIGYKVSHDAEGFAILQALRYIEKHHLLFSQIYTDSASWVHIINIIQKSRGTTQKRKYTGLITREILLLQKKYFVSIRWKGRKHNKAGKFLGSIWKYKETYRDQLSMELTEWKDIVLPIENP